MNDLTDPDAVALLDAYSPPPDVAPDWDDVLRRTPAPGPPRRAWALRSGGALVLAAAVLAVTWLWPRSHDSVVQQALAAIDSGPVLHAVLEIEGKARLVDLRTGASTPIVTRSELWYDGRIGAAEHTRLRGETGPLVYFLRRNEPRLVGRLDAGAEGWFGSYRQALRRGQFRAVGHGRVHGVDVDWLQGQAFELYDPATGDGTTVHDRVAVDRSTFKPVVIETFAGAHRLSAERILSVGAMSLGASPLAHPPARAVLVSETPARDTPSTTLQATTRAMKATPVLPPSTLAGLRRTWIGRPLFLVGAGLADLHEPAGVVLFYGYTLNYAQPDYERRHVAISEFPSPDPVFTGDGRGSFPSSGKAVAVGNTLTFRHAGLFFQVQASSAALALAGARAVART